MKVGLSVAAGSWELNGAAARRFHTFRVDLLAHTTDSRVLDSSVTTIDVEERVVGHY